MKKLHTGDIFEVTLKNTETIRFEKVHSKAGVTFFVLKDLWLCEYPMNCISTNEGGFPNSNINEWLNSVVIALLPDELVEKILPRKITQYIDGKEYSTICKLWIPSAVEVFGKDACSGKALLIEPNNEQFRWFKKAKHRIKGSVDFDPYWWTRTPNPSSSELFWFVYNHGHHTNSSANTHLGVAFGFCM